jgi:hypothetical protein
MNAITSIDNSEPPIPSGHKASEWVRWSNVQVVAYLLGVNEEYTMGENFAVKHQLDKMVAEGKAQHWKQGDW